MKNCDLFDYDNLSEWERKAMKGMGGCSRHADRDLLECPWCEIETLRSMMERTCIGCGRSARYNKVHGVRAPMCNKCREYIRRMMYMSMDALHRARHKHETKVRLWELFDAHLSALNHPGRRRRSQ